MDRTSEGIASILVVEDDRDLANLYAEWLSDSYDVSTAYTGETGLNALDESIDIVLLDRRLPDIPGDDILKHVDDNMKNVQVAIVSGITPDFGMLGLGIEDYLVKPIERDDILSLVSGMLERERPEAEDNPFN